MRRFIEKLAPWTLLTIALVSLRVLGFVLDGEFAEQRHQRCDAMRGEAESTIDEIFGTPQRTWKVGEVECADGRNCSKREYAFGVDWSLVANFEDGELKSCEIYDS